jgi:Uma2 family endonuclease
VSAASIPQPLTVDEFDRLPEPPGGRLELRHGEAVFVSYPEIVHIKVQWRLRELIQSLADAAGLRGVAGSEFPYRPLPEYELWAADVAFVSEARFGSISRWLEGSPELVIEVRSPSNTKQELSDKAMTTLRGGASEFWIVDPALRCVTVFTQNGGISVYRGEQSVPLPMFGSSVSLEQVFEGL